MQYIVSNARGARCDRTHELDPLIDRCVIFLMQIDDLVGRDAQRITHIILYVARRAQHLVYERVERDLERKRSLSEQASEGFVGAFKLGCLQHPRGKSREELVRLARSAHQFERSLACGRGS